MGSCLEIARRRRGRAFAVWPRRRMEASRCAAAASSDERRAERLVPDGVSATGSLRAGGAADRRSVHRHARMVERPPSGIALRPLLGLRFRPHSLSEARQRARHLLRIAGGDAARPQAPRHGPLQRRRPAALSRVGLHEPWRTVPVGGSAGPVAAGRAGVRRPDRHRLAAPQAELRSRRRETRGGGAAAQPGRPADGRRGGTSGFCGVRGGRAAAAEA